MIQLIIAGILLLTGILMMVFGGDKSPSTGYSFNLPSLTQISGFAIFVSGIPCGIFGLISLI